MFIKEKIVDFVGYFFPWDTDFEVGSNARQFLMGPSEHVDVSHIDTKETSFSATNKRKKSNYSNWIVVINNETYSVAKYK